MYINDIPKGENTELVLYADDTAIMASSSESFTQKYREANQEHITTENTEVEEQEAIKYLGVHLDRKLTFQRHIKGTRKKVAAAKNFIAPYITPLSQKLKFQLVRAYISRSYCTQTQSRAQHLKQS